MLGKVRQALKGKRSEDQETPSAYAPLHFKEIHEAANSFADLIESKFEDIIHILLEYESYEVALDEISRTLDLLRNLEENKDFFKVRIGDMAAFLPRNQPLYALSCFVIVPSLMSSGVHFRIPHSMRHFFPKMLALLEVYDRFPNVKVSHGTRLNFLLERSALKVDPVTKETWPVTEAVIFTGTPAHADRLRLVFDQRTLFITNGSGHNPVVIAEDADLKAAVEAVLTLQLYNQGQDCAAPNAILVHKKVFPIVLHMIREGLRAIGVGDYRNRSCRIGPISDPKDLVRIQDFLIDNREWLDITTPGTIRASSATLEPTIICKPLAEGGNFQEIFAPVMFLQEYEEDEQLAHYFEDPKYALNAMYLTIYGTSPYIDTIPGSTINGKVLHDDQSVLRNTHLHAHGIERGTQPYGGYGYGASNLSIGGEIICKPTLPQRDIYEWVAKPYLDKAINKTLQLSLKKMTEIKTKDVQKILRLKSEKEQEEEAAEHPTVVYIDAELVDASGGKRYLEVDDSQLHRLLVSPNAEYIAGLPLKDLETVRALREVILNAEGKTVDEFSTEIYAVAAAPNQSPEEKKAAQLAMFKIVYRLLFNKERGPRLAQFLLDSDREKVCELLDV